MASVWALCTDLKLCTTICLLLLFSSVQNVVQTQTDLNKILNDSIYQELSWSVRLLLLKDFLQPEARNNSNRRRSGRITPMAVGYANPATEAGGRSKTASSLNRGHARRMPEVEALVAAPKIARMRPGKDEMPETKRKMPRMQPLIIKRRQEETTKQETKNDDDNSMRLKLFRLMYETIKDSDMKCKRAELIRSHYENSSAFEIGYLMGDVMDKYNIMSDISMTLNRLFHEWKPIEHINAYEQISNQAIEINHLIDMMKGISRKNETRIRK